ncbi:putative ATP-grasp target RiPP [Sphaerisporangium sp. NPDC051011]|uniref:putative ATP-grasp target RiPP n=1 Tax=Sphaerisporangium sp. NPDC051011 TaxID=3155792 RepID=UPI003406FF45
MSKITIDDLPFEGAELGDAELVQVAGGARPEKHWEASAWTLNDVPYEWWLI